MYIFVYLYLIYIIYNNVYTILYYFILFISVYCFKYLFIQF